MKIFGLFQMSKRRKAGPEETFGIVGRAEMTNILGRFMICTGLRCSYEKGVPNPNSQISLSTVKKRWKKMQLANIFDLAFVGCVGQCDKGNICGIVHTTGSIWLGHMRKKQDYFNLLQWAKKCAKSRQIVEIPSELETHRIE